MVVFGSIQEVFGDQIKRLEAALIKDKVPAQDAHSLAMVLTLAWAWGEGNPLAWQWYEPFWQSEKGKTIITNLFQRFVGHKVGRIWEGTLVEVNEALKKKYPHVRKALYKW